MEFPTQEVVIRVANSNDEQQILDCLAAAFEPYQTQYTAGAFADTTLNMNTLRERMGNMHVLVAISNDAVAGTVSASCGEGTGHLRGMAVLPAYSGSGVAARLLIEIERWLLESSCKHVTLDTTEPLKAAMKFYEKHGYRRSGKVTDFYGMRLLEYEKDLTTF